MWMYGFMCVTRNKRMCIQCPDNANFVCCQLHILSCGIVGSLLCVVMLDVYAGGSVRYLLAVSVWKATVTDYTSVLVVLPFQKTGTVCLRQPCRGSGTSQVSCEILLYCIQY